MLWWQEEDLLKLIVPHSFNFVRSSEHMKKHRRQCGEGEAVKPAAVRGRFIEDISFTQKEANVQGELGQGMTNNSVFKYYSNRWTK